MQRFAVITKQDEKSYQLKKQIIAGLNDLYTYDEMAPDLVIFIGGDGTMLDACHRYLQRLDTCRFVGIHTGTLGFYTDYLDSEVERLIEDIHKNHFTLDYRDLLEIEAGHELRYALNEMRLEENQRTMVCDVYIDGEFLETFRGNGLCISTPSGSTAYNRSLGGSVIAPTLHCMQLSEIAGIHHNAYRSLGSSLVVDAQSEIILKPKDYCYVLGADREASRIHSGEIRVRLSKQSVCFIHFNQKSMLQRLRKAFISG